MHSTGDTKTSDMMCAVSACLPRERARAHANCFARATLNLIILPLCLPFVCVVLSFDFSSFISSTFVIVIVHFPLRFFYVSCLRKRIRLKRFNDFKIQLFQLFCVNNITTEMTIKREKKFLEIALDCLLLFVNKNV